MNKGSNKVGVDIPQWRGDQQQSRLGYHFHSIADIAKNSQMSNHFQQHSGASTGITGIATAGIFQLWLLILNQLWWFTITSCHCASPPPRGAYRLSSWSAWPLNGILMVLSHSGYSFLRICMSRLHKTWLFISLLTFCRYELGRKLLGIALVSLRKYTWSEVK